ncbi:cytochrome c [uncultured Neptuniibacter sp.]|uniref:c-type cytochrome n=1 Tax=uncultured Neptuniibacter sp. TaxID=502143 RepID=UPI00261009CC|nr:cytochrome c [uncultured Neptuniibacter sp.]
MKLYRYGLVLFCIGLVGCGDDKLPENANGKELYTYHCSGCHKSSGRGDFIKGVPANSATKLSEYQIAKMIRHGDVKKPGMPVFDNISREEAALIAGYVINQL